MYHPNQIKEETQVIFQDRAIDFRVLDQQNSDHRTKFNGTERHLAGLLKLKPGKKCHIRLYTSTAGIKIDGFELDQVNQNFLAGNTPFVILENSGKFAQRYQQLGCEIKLVVPKNQGHNLWSGFFRCQQLVDFVISHSK